MCVCVCDVYFVKYFVRKIIVIHHLVLRAWNSFLKRLRTREIMTDNDNDDNDNEINAILGWL